MGQVLLLEREGLETLLRILGLLSLTFLKAKADRARDGQILMLRNTLLILIMGLSLFGCSTQSDHGEQRLLVYAASSLTDILKKVEKQFELKHPTIDLDVAYSGSQTLRLQIQQGAPADVFISANRKHMNMLVNEGKITERRILAYNRLALVLPKGNPAGITQVTELDKAKRLVIGTSGVPIGRYTRLWLSKMNQVVDGDFSQRVLKRVVSQENNVRLLRAKVELGEADAAIVYFTDAISSEGVEYLPIEEELNIRTEYQLGVVSQKKTKSALGVWLAFLGSDEVRKLMAEEGLGLP